jgi:hypothetical protein
MSHRLLIVCVWVYKIIKFFACLRVGEMPKDAQTRANLPKFVSMSHPKILETLFDGQRNIFKLALLRRRAIREKMAKLQKTRKPTACTSRQLFLNF